jgi:predicted PurR-regulated permease PerM
MCVGWMWSNIVAGAIEAALVAVVLGVLQVPGAAVWAALAFFAELIPKVGAYIMGIPPTLVALADSPMTALWVALFYVLMNEIVGNFVVPKIRATSMEMHASSVMFMMLWMAYAFGLAGALIATPITGFIKAYYEEFYLARRAPVAEHGPQVNRMIAGRLPD